MTPTANPIRPARVNRIKRDPVKLTALLYLREALNKEKYEECAEYIQVALEFGAEEFEVRNILEDPRRMPKL